MQVMRFASALLAVLALTIVLIAATACGDDDDSNTPTPAPGVQLTDEQYLDAICTGTKDLSDALITKTSADEIAKVIKDFSARMKLLNPPSDLQQFQTDFTKYLDDAVSHPTSIITKDPPVPPNKVRDRLISKEPNVASCNGQQTFFDSSAAKENATPALPLPSQTP
jgi:hypothetical protein